MGRRLLRSLPALVGLIVVVVGVSFGFGEGGSPMTAASATFRLESPQRSGLTGEWTYVAPPVRPTPIQVGDARVMDLRLYSFDGQPFPGLPIVPNAINELAPVVLPVMGARGSVLQVRIGPPGPAQTVALVDRDDMTVRPSGTTIVVELGARRLSLYDGDELLWTEPAHVGGATSPSHTGDFYVKASAALPEGDPAGAARLVLGQFTYLDGSRWVTGPLVIEGAAPEPLGQPITDGRILVSDSVITQLLALAPQGTPVQIIA